MKITDRKSAIQACDKLHSLGVQTVVITSSDLPANQDESMLVILSTPWKFVEDDLADHPGVKQSGKYARYVLLWFYANGDTLFLSQGWFDWLQV